MKEIFKNLFKVKSLMTIAVMTVFTILSLRESLDPALTAGVISSVITYYFTKQTNAASQASLKDGYPNETAAPAKENTVTNTYIKETETGERH